jgi:hypothetical protein
MPGFDLRSTENGSDASSDRPSQLRSAGDLDLIGIKPDCNKKQTINLNYQLYRRPGLPSPSHSSQRGRRREGERGASWRWATLKVRGGGGKRGRGRILFVPR